jgi:hypothetical protein
VVSAADSKSLLPLAKGEKVAGRPDEGVIRYFCRLEILNGVARTADLRHRRLRLCGRRKKYFHFSFRVRFKHPV